MTTRKYDSIEDLLFDKSFRDWILYCKDANDFWLRWMENNPGKADIVNYAKAILFTISVRNAEISEDEIQYEIDKVLAEMNEGFGDAESLEVNEAGMLIKKQVSLKKWLGVAVLSIVIVLAVGYFITDRRSSIQFASEASQLSLDGHIYIAAVIRYNASDTNEAVLLPDGSQVRLSPRSKLMYDANDFSTNREISLQGEGFFNVQKDPAHPFTVHTKSVVTKVLGTSFFVKEFSHDKTASVIVRTGRVSVYKQKDFIEENKKLKPLSGVILTPNQQITYTISNRELTKSIIEKPVLLTETRPLFNFNATPVQDVFDILEEAYGINIICDVELIVGRTLSASFGKEDFYQKLMIICKAINATYELIDGTVVINFRE